MLAAVPLAYILPALCFIQLEEGAVFSSKKLPALGVVLFGLTVAILGVFFLIMDFDKVDTCSHGKVMSYCIEGAQNLTNATFAIHSKTL